MTDTTTGRILTLYIPLNLDPKLNLENHIIYRGKKVVLSESDLEELLTSLTEYWHSSRDRLIHFSINTDGTYLCERNKDTYNFYTKQTETKIYYFDTAAEENVKQCTDKILSFFEKKQLESITNLQETFVKQFKNLNFFSAHLIEMRQMFLQESDYMFMADYPLDPAEKEKWAIFRQELRDITEQEAWKNNDFLNVSFPVSPLAKEQAERMSAVARMSGLVPSLTNAFADCRLTSDFITEYGKIIVKMRMITVLAGLGLPSVKQILGFGLPEFHMKEEYTKIYGNNIPWPYGECPIDAGVLQPAEFINEFSKVDLVGRINDYVSTIDETIKKIDPNLTVGDVWQMAEDFVKSTTEVDDLLQDLETQGDN